MPFLTALDARFCFTDGNGGQFPANLDDSPSKVPE
jgi:hypothetical protein